MQDSVRQGLPERNSRRLPDEEEENVPHRQRDGQEVQNVQQVRLAGEAGGPALLKRIFLRHDNDVKKKKFERSNKMTQFLLHSEIDKLQIWNH